MDLPKVKAVLFTGKKYKDGKHPILIRITQNRKHTYKSTGFAISPEAWDNDNSQVYEKKPQVTKRQVGQVNSSKLTDLQERYRSAIILTNAKHINSVIQNTIAEINTLTQKLKVNEQSLDVKSIKLILDPSSSSNNKLSFTFLGKEIYEKHLRSGSIGTAKRYRTVKKNINLKSQGYKVNTIHNNLKTIRAIFYAAMKEGIISPEKNPFLVFKLKLDNKIKKEKLTVEEIIAIEQLVLERETLIWHVRNCFLFSFYCAGIRVSDLLQLKWSNITSVGRLDYQMEKTGKQKSINLIPKAKKIIEEYKKDKSHPSHFIFPLIPFDADIKAPSVLFNQISSKTALLNKYLKKIAVLAGIEKPLSTHIARHSFSDIARKRKASIYDISKMLGHSSIKITEMYLASLDLDSQDETHRNIMDY